jgi:hypothetical protein
MTVVRESTCRATPERKPVTRVHGNRHVGSPTIVGIVYAADLRTAAWVIAQLRPAEARS